MTMRSVSGAETLYCEGVKHQRPCDSQVVSDVGEYRMWMKEMRVMTRNIRVCLMTTNI